MDEQITGRGQAAPEPFEPTMTLRPAVAWFAQRLEAKLRANEHKGDWHDIPYIRLLWMLRREVSELQDALVMGPDGGVDTENVINEAADVANFAMMIATIAERERIQRDAEKLRQRLEGATFHD